MIVINCIGSDTIQLHENEIDPHYCDVIRKRWTKWAVENGVEVGSGALR